MNPPETIPPLSRTARLTSAGPGASSGWAGDFGRGDAALWCDARTLITRCVGSGPVREWRDPLEALQWMAESLREKQSDEARWVGYLGYDLGQQFENLPARAADDLGLPLFVFTLHRPPFAPRVERGHDPAGPRVSRVLRSTFSRDAYERAVRKAIDYIAAGDVFQVNLSQRLSVESSLSPEAVLRRLEAGGGARYGACLDYGSFAVVSNSPELFLRVTSLPDGRRHVVTRPIKGTRPRGPGMAEALRASAKDQAELNMIVDLERNDLGRVCEVGTVRVTEPRAIEAHPTVYHGVATVEGVLRGGVSFVDLLRATFPGGSVTGAPKIRAMQIIDELEPVRRGPYCGAVGYLSADGSMEFNVAIRTTVLKDGVAYVPVGGGIVADSDPAAEYEETLVKAKAMLGALGVRPA